MKFHDCVDCSFLGAEHICDACDSGEQFEDRGIPDLDFNDHSFTDDGDNDE